VQPVAEVTTSKLDQAVQDFVNDNPEVVEALEVFGIATAEYERALRALYPCVSYTGASTQPAR
jgi:hypothetical protein